MYTLTGYLKHLFDNQQEALRRADQLNAGLESGVYSRIDAHFAVRNGKTIGRYKTAIDAKMALGASIGYKPRPKRLKVAPTPAIYPPKYSTPTMRLHQLTGQSNCRYCGGDNPHCDYCSSSSSTSYDMRSDD